jgi:photosystem II stability/assembly factor-like uncharacterized protein
MAASIARRVRLGRKVCRSGECFAGLGGSVRKVTAMKTILVLLVFSIAPLVSTAATPASPSPLAHLTFRDIGPAVAGGRVTSIAGIPGQPGTYVVGAAGGGVWKTTDGGDTWIPIFEHQRDASVGAVALAPSNPNIIWVGTGEANIRNDVINGHGVYVSTDGGRTWRSAGLADVGHISRIVIDPTNPDVVFVAALGHAWAPNPERGIFRTADGGRTWKKVLFVDAQTGASDLKMQPGNPQVLFAAMWQVRRLPWELVDGGPGSGVYRSTDGGSTWTRLTNGLPKGPIGRIAIGVSPSRPSHLYALIESSEGTLWDSTDAGDHWKMVSGNHALDVRPFYFSQVDVAPNDDRTVYFSSFKLMVSHDGGRTAHVLDRRVHPDHHALWIDPENPQRMIQGNDGGVFLSHDGGRTWRFLDNLPIEQFYQVAADSRSPYDLCGGLQDNSAWCGPSNTLTRGGITGARWFTVIGGDGEYAVPAPSNPDVVYADAQNGFATRLELEKNVDRFIRPYLPGVEDMKPADLKYRFNWTSPIAVSPRNPEEVYLGANVLFRSTDGGSHWSAISPDLTNNDKRKQQISGGPIDHDISGAETYNTILSITLAPTDPNVIWIGTDDGNVQVTRNGGKSWTNVRPTGAGLPPEGRVYQVGVSPFDAGTAYVAIDYHEFDNSTPYVFKTSDYGSTWTSISRGLPDDRPAHVVREDPNHRGLLVLGTDTTLWVSPDAGRTWQTLAPGFPTAPVYDLQFVPGTHALAVATHGRGVFVLDDMTPVEEWNPQVQSAALHVFKPQTATVYQRNRSAEAPSRYSAPNPPRGATIAYYLKSAVEAPAGEKTPHAGPVTILVTDAKGRTVFTGHGPGKAGINDFSWNLRHDAPLKLSVAPPSSPETREYGLSESGPLALPGTYTITVEAGNETARRSLEVRPDPRLPFDLAAARAQESLGLELRDRVSDMDRLLNALHGLQGQMTNVENVMGSRTGRAEEAGAGSHEVLLARVADVRRKTTALMDEIYNPLVQRAVVEDDIHHLTRLYDRLTSLAQGADEGYDQAPSDLERNEANVLEKELDAEIAAYHALASRDIASFDRLAASDNAPILVAPPVSGANPDAGVRSSLGRR